MSDKKKILFWPDVYKEQGHWLPTLAWADYLKEWHDINYMGIADCQEIVTKYNLKNGTNFGYETIFSCQEKSVDYSIYPYGYTNEVVTTPGTRWKTDHIWTLVAAGFDSEKSLNKVGFPSDTKIYKCAQEFRKIWKRINPDLLISGYFTALELLIIYYHHHVKTKVFTNEKIQFAFSTTYLRHPEEDPAAHALQNLQAFSVAEQNKIINMVKNDSDDVDTIYDDPGISLEEFVSPLSTFHEFIPCIKSFDYSQYEHGSKVHYVEPCMTKELEPDNNEYSDEYWHDFLNAHKKIVFVTAGSQILDYKEKALILFQSIIDAMQASDMSGYQLVLCAGATLVQELKSDYENVSIFGWVPQRKILESLADTEHTGSCAIIHGGLATIKECVYCNVPFLVLPLGKDQMDNALRLEDYGINNYFYIEFIKPKCLLYFINQILQDYVSLANLAALSKEFHIAENSHVGAKYIKELVETGRIEEFDGPAVEESDSD
ncbi:UDP:flavonoid glycosyltransferase YjiC, YdhE family [Fibrobacter sp. UWCM]|uniref:glycosyltransferase n=1 Tax=Fibrobacter sp. UWCM TaxID=1896208 RepID=UPI0009233D0D|nr:glycosyltransferase [Fibrobacter sp. UWCM]SHH74499.1 UDP:flavonoid glycosyltransferase YjiC, YdhE family [Fibrobacter sp. UWCM]